MMNFWSTRDSASEPGGGDTAQRHASQKPASLSSLASDMAEMKSSIDALSRQMGQLDAIADMMQTLVGQGARPGRKVSIEVPAKRNSVSAPGDMGMQNGAGLCNNVRRSSSSRRVRGRLSCAAPLASASSSSVGDVDAVSTPAEAEDDFAADYTMLNRMLDDLRSQGMKQIDTKSSTKARSHGRAGGKGRAYGVTGLEANQRKEGETRASAERAASRRERLQELPPITRAQEYASEMMVSACSYVPLFHPEVRR